MLGVFIHGEATSPARDCLGPVDTAAQRRRVRHLHPRRGNIAGARLPGTGGHGDSELGAFIRAEATSPARDCLGPADTSTQRRQAQVRAAVHGEGDPSLLPR